MGTGRSTPNEKLHVHHFLILVDRSKRVGSDPVNFQDTVKNDVNELTAPMVFRIFVKRTNMKIMVSC